MNATLGSNGNTGFLEHFRYQIIASQLLDENVGSVTSPTQPCGHPPLRSPLPELTATTTGACAATAISFTFVWIIQWARSEGNTKLWGWRALVATTFSLLLVVGIWVYTTRRSILYLRRNALDATSTFTTNLQSLNSSSTSVLSLIQEVELVSRGYRMLVSTRTSLNGIKLILRSTEATRCHRFRALKGRTSLEKHKGYDEYFRKATNA